MYYDIYKYSVATKPYYLGSLDKRGATKRRAESFKLMLQDIFPIRGQIQLKRTTKKESYVKTYSPDQITQDTVYSIYLSRKFFKIYDFDEDNYNNRVDLFVTILHEYRHVFQSQIFDLNAEKKPDYDDFKDPFEIDAYAFSALFLEMWFDKELIFDNIPEEYQQIYSEQKEKIKLVVYKSIFRYIRSQNIGA